MDRHRPSLIRRAAIAFVPLAFLGYLFVYPQVEVLRLALGDGATSGFVEVLTTPRLRSSVWFTVWQATLSTILTLLAAWPITWAIARFRFPGRSLARALVAVPFVLPTVVVGTAFVALGVEGSLMAILAAHVFYNVAVVVRTVGGLWSRIDPSLVEAARTLGASPWAAFRRVTLPLLSPALLAASSIVFLFTFTSFGVVLILGGQQYRTIEVEIYQQAITFLDLEVAGALAVLQLIGVTAALALYSRHQERTATRVRLVSEDSSLRTPRGLERLGVIGAVVVSTGLLALPLGALVARSLGAGGEGWAFLADPGPAAVSPAEAVGNSLGFAAIATLVALGVGMAAAVVVAGRWGRLSRWFDVVLMLPLGASAVTIGFGMLVALDQPIDLRTSIVLVPLAHALVAVPFVVRTTVPVLGSIRRDLREAAAVLGASPARVFRHVDLPIVARAAAVGAGFAAAISLGEFGATALLARPATTTVPFLIYRYLARPGAVTYSAAMALSVILAILTGALIMSIDRLRAGELGRF